VQVLQAWQNSRNCIQLKEEWYVTFIVDKGNKSKLFLIDYILLKALTVV
jgi:hypothetical protein